MKKGFIFDLDGVIVDTAKYHYLAWKNLANSLGFEFTPEHNERFKGVSRVRSLDILLEIGNYTATQAQKEHWLVQKNEEYLAYIEKMDAKEILPDVPRVLTYIAAQQQGIALGSASKNARPILERVALLSQFHAIVDGNDVTTAKPDPEVFLLGAQQLEIAPQNCIVFEDSIAGIEAANAAGMISIGIGDAKTLHKANHIFTDFTDMSDAFLQNLIDC